MKERGYTFLEIAVVVAILLILTAVAAPSLRAALCERELLGAGFTFRGEFVKARSLAVRGNTSAAIRFERRADDVYYSVYADGNGNGVLAADIAAGIDRRVSGPLPLSAGRPGVKVGIRPGTPAIPPESGVLDPTDPIRFGRSDMVSFSPLGTSSPGTFYLMGDSGQIAVRVSSQTARVRLLVF